MEGIYELQSLFAVLGWLGLPVETPRLNEACEYAVKYNYDIRIQESKGSEFDYMFEEMSNEELEVMGDEYVSWYTDLVVDKYGNIIGEGDE